LPTLYGTLNMNRVSPADEMLTMHAMEVVPEREGQLPERHAAIAHIQGLTEGIVHQDIELPLFFLDAPEQRLHLRVLAMIAANRNASAAEAVHRQGGFADGA
jgi:hypothetical protein